MSEWQNIFYKAKAVVYTEEASLHVTLDLTLTLCMFVMPWSHCCALSPRMPNVCTLVYIRARYNSFVEER